MNENHHFESSHSIPSFPSPLTKKRQLGEEQKKIVLQTILSTCAHQPRDCHFSSMRNTAQSLQRQNLFYSQAAVITFSYCVAGQPVIHLLLKRMTYMSV